MRRIVLLCAAGLSTSILVKKMEHAAEEIGYEVEIGAYPAPEAKTVGVGADIILLAPQAAWKISQIRDLFPDLPVEPVDMQAYGLGDGEKVIKFVKEKLGDG